MGDANFLMPWDITQSTTEANQDIPVSAGTASKLIFRLGTAVTGTQTATLTLRKNGIDTAITCTITSTTNAGLFCTDFTNTATYANGDSLSIRYNEANAPASSRVKYSIQYATQ